MFSFKKIDLISREGFQGKTTDVKATERSTNRILYLEAKENIRKA